MSTYPICLSCRHLRAGESPMRCAAFPIRIPEVILLSRADHRRPYPGDHGIVFEYRAGAPAIVSPRR